MYKMEEDIKEIKEDLRVIKEMTYQTGCMTSFVFGATLGALIGNTVGILLVRYFHKC